MPVFLKYGNIKGDVTEPSHRSWIALTSVQLGQVKRVRPSGREGESPNLTEILVTKKADNASVHLFRESISGKGVDAVIDFVRESGGTYLRIEMSDTLIASYNVSGSGSDAAESLTLNSNKITFTHEPGTPPP